MSDTPMGEHFMQAVVGIAGKEAAAPPVPGGGPPGDELCWGDVGRSGSRCVLSRGHAGFPATCTDSLHSSTEAVQEVLIRMGLAGDWPNIHVRAAASMCARAATQGPAGFRVAGESVSDAVGEEFGRLIAERDRLQQVVAEPCVHCGDPMGRGDDACYTCYGIEQGKVRVLQEQLDAAAPVPSGRAEAPWAAIREWQEAHRHSIAAYRAWDAACNAPGKPHAIEARFRLQDAMNRVQRAEEILAALSPAGPPEGGERKWERHFHRMMALIADDVWAASFQTMGQYRDALWREMAAPSTGEGDSRRKDD